MSLISSYLLALLLTIVIELIIAFFFGFRKKIEIIAIVFINLFTNLILNYFLLVNDHFFFFKSSLLIILFLEIVVVLIEWKLLVFALQEKSRKLLALSLVMNFCSYIIGVLIFR
ncbi:MAG: hypothetical protein WC705_01955 [Candidatus Paceibacterota bacterium]